MPVLKQIEEVSLETPERAGIGRQLRQGGERASSELALQDCRGMRRGDCATG